MSPSVGSRQSSYQQLDSRSVRSFASDEYSSGQTNGLYSPFFSGLEIQLPASALNSSSSSAHDLSPPLPPRPLDLLRSTSAGRESEFARPWAPGPGYPSPRSSPSLSAPSAHGIPVYTAGGVPMEPQRQRYSQGVTQPVRDRNQHQHYHQHYQHVTTPGAFPASAAAPAAPSWGSRTAAAAGSPGDPGRPVGAAAAVGHMRPLSVRSSSSSVGSLSSLHGTRHPGQHAHPATDAAWRHRDSYASDIAEND
ncbi:hypothetical protein HK405_012547 [Cladochytrium tenue]|nr:hypothetical protein HK405_012547 [Cladochytrium tenue]